MFKVLLKKQIAEVFKGYFFNAKKNKMRSKWAIAAYFVFFVLIMAGLLGGIFTYLSIMLCDGLAGIGMGWLYFLLLGGIAIMLGSFGSIFNTYAGLYLSKDNDLLLSMPIPVRTIITARLTNVYLMGAMYASVVMLPALIVYWVKAGLTPARLICGIILFLIVTFIVLILSALLGWVVAKISLKLKNKSFVSVLASLVFIGLYYFVYFRANAMLQGIILNADIYGAKIKGAAYSLYLFGRTGEGDMKAAAIWLLITAVLFAAVWFVLTRSFLKIATSSGKTGKVRYVEKTVRQKTIFSALLGKEFGRFTASSNYMLNCGLAVLLIPVSGVAMLVKGRMVFDTLEQVFYKIPGSTAVLICAAFCMLVSMNDMAAPSVSLEGKSIWIPQSLPVSPKTVLRAKASMQLILSGIPILFASICAVVVLRTSVSLKILVCIMPLVYTVFSALFATFISVRMPLLSWTDETAPIKQSGAVTITLLGGWALSAGIGILYMFIGYKIGPVPYLLLWTVLFAAAGCILLHWLDTKGGLAFASL